MFSGLKIKKRNKLSASKLKPFKPKIKCENWKNIYQMEVWKNLWNSKIKLKCKYKKYKNILNLKIGSRELHVATAVVI